MYLSLSPTVSITAALQVSPFIHTALLHSSPWKRVIQVRSAHDPAAHITVRPSCLLRRLQLYVRHYAMVCSPFSTRVSCPRRRGLVLYISPSSVFEVVRLHRHVLTALGDAGSYSNATSC
ncbi:hypothetical protein PENSPDRAFT_648590 [Peniophora sp. CONT]|nr:hypothetical protein PENSPDRAFT_648590 [Peniophora sp. CONT]